MSEIAANLAISQAEACEDFAMRFARFAGPTRKQRIRTLLAEPADPDQRRNHTRNASTAEQRQTRWPRT